MKAMTHPPGAISAMSGQKAGLFFAKGDMMSGDIGHGLPHSLSEAMGMSKEMQGGCHGGCAPHDIGLMIKGADLKPDIGLTCKVEYAKHGLVDADLKPDDNFSRMVHAPGQSHGHLGASFTECDFYSTHGLGQSVGKVCETHPTLTAAALLAAHHSMAAITAGAAMPTG